MPRPHTRTWIALAAAVAAAYPSIASARECTSNSGCPLGFLCSVADAGMGICESLPCVGNADCAPAFLCSVPEGAAIGACAPQWDVPCVSAEDCGPGFSCQDGGGGWPYGPAGHQASPTFYCEGAQDFDASPPSYYTVATISCEDLGTLCGSGCGIATTVAVDGESPPGLPNPNPTLCEPGSTCTEITYNSCEADWSQSCIVDSDCASGWTCQCPPVIPHSIGGMLDAGQATQDATVDVTCGTICLPPNADLAGYGDVVEAPDASLATSNVVGAAANDAGVTLDSASATSNVVEAVPLVSSNRGAGCSIGETGGLAPGGGVVLPFALLGASGWRRRKRWAGVSRV